MGKSVKDPEYTSATYNTGDLFGSSTSNKDGTTFTPTGWQKNTMNVVGNALPTTLNNMLSNDYSNDPNFQAYKNNFDRLASQSFDANVLSPLANRGLMRSSGLQASTNSFNETMNNNLTNLMDNYYNRQANNLSSLLNTSNSLFNYITGINNGALSNANAINDYNFKKYQADLQAKNANSALWSNLANAAGTLGGFAAMGPIGAAVGSKLFGTAANAAT